MYGYTHIDLDCDYCLHCNQCKFDICPSILDCLEDLYSSPEEFLKKSAMPPRSGKTEYSLIFVMSRNSRAAGIMSFRKTTLLIA